MDGRPEDQFYGFFGVVHNNSASPCGIRAHSHGVTCKDEIMSIVPYFIVQKL